MEELQEFRQELHHQVHLKELDINREEGIEVGILKGTAKAIKAFISKNPKINNYKEIASLFGFEESYVRKLLAE